MFEPASPCVPSRNAQMAASRGARDQHATRILKVRPESSALRDRNLGVANRIDTAIYGFEQRPFGSESRMCRSVRKRKRTVPERVFLATAARIFPDKACYDSGMFALAITVVILSEP